MTTDLLFSILPRQGTVPMDKDGQKVQKLNKETALRAVNEDDRPFNRRKARGNNSGKYHGPYDRRSSRTRRDPSEKDKQQKQARQQAQQAKPQTDTKAQPSEIKKFKPLDLYV